MRLPLKPIGNAKTKGDTFFIDGFGKRRAPGFAIGHTLVGRLGALACLEHARIKHNVSRATESRTRIAGWTVEGLTAYPEVRRHQRERSKPFHPTSIRTFAGSLRRALQRPILGAAKSPNAGPNSRRL